MEDPPRFATVTDAGGRIVAATLRTPPHNLVLSSIDDLAAVDALVEALRDEALPGVLGPVERGRTIRGADGPLRPGNAALRSRSRSASFVSSASSHPNGRRRGRGEWREKRDRDLIVRWLIAFMAEAQPEAPPRRIPGGAADRWIERRGRTLYLWEDGGQSVSLVGAGGETPNGIRIGPVYTPPDRRGRGYASSLTAAASADQLTGGRVRASCSPTSPIRPRTRSTRQSAFSRSATSINIASRPMRRAVLVALVLIAGCSTPAGEERHGCNAEWLDVPPVATQVGGVDERALPIDCIGQIRTAACASASASRRAQLLHPQPRGAPGVG